MTRFPPYPEREFAQFILAGFFSAVHRHFDGTREDEFFLNAVRGAIEEHGDDMLEVLSMIDGFLYGPGVEWRGTLLGTFADSDIRAPADFAERAAELRRVLSQELIPPMQQLLLTPLGWAYALGSEGIDPARKFRVGGSIATAAGEALGTLARGTLELAGEVAQEVAAGVKSGKDKKAEPTEKGKDNSTEKGKDEPGAPAVAPPPVPACPHLGAMIENVTIHEKTQGFLTSRAGKDDVLLTYSSQGQVGQPVNAHWPINGGAFEADKDPQHPIPVNMDLGRYAGGSGCVAMMAASVNLWEADFGDIDRNLRQTAKQLAPLVSQLAAATQTPLTPVVTPTPGLIESSLNALLDLLQLSDDWMGAMNFSVWGVLNLATPIKKYSWWPFWGSQNKMDGGLHMDSPTRNFARLTQEFRAHGGHWALSVQVQVYP